ncbi:hypothetical protein IGB42_03432 [Andreprevotia sp. IGB-42]|uniref:hypothetical protein n=1 Tax=Andreprevotia sp. IGB-42 TaxID=2497473 RepID=UPI001358FA6E|nr:hypothetical protein [Andreprevotia sp. IGB-42]KAF0812154.1 hypothetical protein IGB42_03432 [Andreprevotia sp. IGB-42]
MKKMLFALVAITAATAVSAADVGISVNIGDPNFYGQIAIGNYPRPQVIYQEPVVVVKERRYYEPVYMRVPPGHAQRWRQYCGQYNACGRPVYFVRNEWYSNVYAPRYREDHRGPPPRRDDDRRGNDRDRWDRGHDDHHDHRDHDRDGRDDRWRRG